MSDLKPTPGKFITLEGPEGAGKSTQLHLLAEYLRSRHFRVKETREPGGTPIGQAIREMLFSPRYRGINARTELLLINAARAQHVEEVIKPSLEAGMIVLCDRYVESSLAYQGWGRQLDDQDVRRICQFATTDLRPDLILLLDIDVREGLERNICSVNGRNRKRHGVIPGQHDLFGWQIEDQKNPFEEANLEFHERVRKGFRAMAELEPQRFAVFDASVDVKTLEAEIRKAVGERLGLR